MGADAAALLGGHLVDCGCKEPTTLALVWRAAAAWFCHRLWWPHLNMLVLKCKLTPSIGPTVLLPAAGGRGLYWLLYPRFSIQGFNSVSKTSCWTSALAQQAKAGQGHSCQQGCTQCCNFCCAAVSGFEAGLSCQLGRILC